MSAGLHSFPTLPPDREVLGDLLHSLSQPLTTLRCSLELSIDHPAAQNQQTVAAALEQTEAAIGMVQLMQQYLDAADPDESEVVLLEVLQRVCDDMSSILALRGVRLRIAGTSKVRLRISGARLGSALQYLILALTERYSDGAEIELALGEGPDGFVLRAQGDRYYYLGEAGDSKKGLGTPEFKYNSVRASVRRTQIAIAARALERAGAPLAWSDDTPGFRLLIPWSSASV